MRKRAITTFLSRKFMITHLLIGFEDFLGSSIASQVMPPWFRYPESGWRSLSSMLTTRDKTSYMHFLYCLKHKEVILLSGKYNHSRYQWKNKRINPKGFRIYSQPYFQICLKWMALFWSFKRKTENIHLQKSFHHYEKLS